MCVWSYHLWVDEVLAGAGAGAFFLFFLFDRGCFFVMMVLQCSYGNGEMCVTATCVADENR